MIRKSNVKKDSNESSKKPSMKKDQQAKNHPQIEQKQILSAEEIDFDPDDSNQKFFNLKDVKPLDLKAQWLGNTKDVLSKFDSKMEELKKEKKIIKAGFQTFAENQHKFKISSLRKINFQLDKKALYQKFMKQTRKTVQKLHPSLILNICGYMSANVFLSLSKLRRVSQIFNYIYKNQQVITLFSQKNFGLVNMTLNDQVKWCKMYVNFIQTFLYYKQIKYTHLIPQNSIKEDLQKAVSFINDVYKLMYQGQQIQIGYFHLLNQFMKIHRVPIALESLSFTDMAVTKKGAIVAFSNFLAFNPSSRLKQQISKTKYLKMIEMVQDDKECRDALVVNSRISNFLFEEYKYQIAVFVDTLKAYPYHLKLQTYTSFNLVVFHLHNPLKSCLAKGITLEEGHFETSNVLLEFSDDLKGCRLNYSAGEGLESEYILHRYLPLIGPDHKFGHCYVFRGEFYYIMLIPISQEPIL